MRLESVDIGILGAGQLARMLAEAAIKNDFQAGIFSKQEDDPARIKNVKIFSDLNELCQQSKTVIFESEFIDIAELRAFGTSNFFPTLNAIESIQDKLAQKKMFKRLKIPSANFLELEGSDREFGFDKAVFKMARQAYDGKGNFFFLKGENEKNLEKFLQQAKDRRIQVFVEECINFQQEVAITGCRLDQDFSFFPLVQSIQEKGVCKWVRGPAEKITPDLDVEEQAQEIFKKIAMDLGYEGVLSIEFFVDENRRLLVNELAPRVHNSAHYSLLAASSSQFEVQVIAAAARSLIRPVIQAPFFGMFNLLSPFVDGEFDYSPENQSGVSDEFEIYWYGKKRLSLGRKMGHISYQAQSKDALERIEERIIKWESDFWAKENRN
ncbi:MAG: ATP-grasp domain-containing protein [Bdellovibrionota bacterium]